MVTRAEGRPRLPRHRDGPDGDQPRRGGAIVHRRGGRPRRLQALFNRRGWSTFNGRDRRSVRRGIGVSVEKRASVGATDYADPNTVNSAICGRLPVPLICWRQLNTFGDSFLVGLLTQLRP
jgi:hypothetical protein